MTTPACPFTDEERGLLEGIATRIAQARMAVPAMLFLESVEPMNYVTSAMLTVASPVWRVAIPGSRIEEVARLLEKRGAIPTFLQYIDDAEDRRLTEARAAKKARRTSQPPEPTP